MDIIKQDGRRHRRYHSAEFKAEVVAQCLQPHVSMASVARVHNLNANLVRQWVAAHERTREPQRTLSALDEGPTQAAWPAFVAVQSTGSCRAVALDSPPGPATPAIRVQLKRGQWSLELQWPASQGRELAACLRELLA